LIRFLYLIYKNCKL